VPAPELRFRVTSPALLALPWRAPLADWDVTAVSFRDIPVGPSRHLVRFVEADDRVWALKELPRRVALKEYAALREMENRAMPAVRAAGVVLQPFGDAAILVTHYLDGSWQYRRLFMRVPITNRAHRSRLLDAMAALLVELHRHGVYWGDASLANTLFRRDGQVISAWLVDAETAELHPSLSDGQRHLDLEILVENVLGGLLDVAARRDEPPDAQSAIYEEAQDVADRYRSLWDLLHDRPVLQPEFLDQVQARLRALNELGFAVDEVRLEPASDESDAVRLETGVAARTFHVDELRSLTGLEVGEGQATILLNDLRSHQRRLHTEKAREVPLAEAARDWLETMFTPRSALAHRALQGTGDSVQAFCDLLEVRWLLSEKAGRDVGDEPALEALARRVPPDDSAAYLGLVELRTAELPLVTSEHLERGGPPPPENDEDDEPPMDR
jgi:hypothetical protein